VAPSDAVLWSFASISAIQPWQKWQIECPWMRLCRWEHINQTQAENDRIGSKR
jgi:hypothetical protein